MDQYLERLQEILRAACQGMSPDDMAYQPPEKWSAANVLEHLYLTYTGTCKGFERCLQAGKPLARKPSLKDRMVVAYVIQIGHFPGGREAPGPTRPQGMDGQKLREEIGPQIMAMGKLIAECEARFGGNKKLLDHPILGPLTGREWRKFHYLHGRHHAQQILRLGESRRGLPKEKPTARTEAWFQIGGIAVSLFPHGGRHAGLAGVLLHVIEGLLGGVQCLLLILKLLLVFRIFLIPCRSISQAVAGIGRKSGGA